MYSSAYIWGKVIGLLEEKLTPALVSSWIDDADVLELTEEKLVLFTPSVYRKDVIERRFAANIHDALQELFDMDVKIIVLTDIDMEAYQEEKSKPAPLDFNPQFTFDKFIVGSSNNFAYSAAYAVANHPAEVYNPLFIYGPSGLGKTHLLYAIANFLRRSQPEVNIVYIRGDQFTNELISALQMGKNVEFRSKYRNADLFLVDDIQFISGKESTQEEFFHTFNTLYENHKQIVLTSDRPPNEMLRLQERLQTRFEWGLICDIHPPDYETRVAITRTKAEELGVKLTDDVCNYIAENITNNIRQIEGTVKKIKAYHDMQGMPLNLSYVSRAIKDMYKGKSETLPTPSLIIKEVCRYYSVEERALRGTLKNKDTAQARHVAMYLISKLTNLSTTDVGKEFSKDHTSVVYAVKKMEKALELPNSATAAAVKEITANINANL